MRLAKGLQGCYKTCILAAHKVFTCAPNSPSLSTSSVNALRLSAVDSTPGAALAALMLSSIFMNSVGTARSSATYACDGSLDQLCMLRHRACWGPNTGSETGKPMHAGLRSEQTRLYNMLKGSAFSSAQSRASNDAKP